MAIRCLLRLPSLLPHCLRNDGFASDFAVDFPQQTNWVNVAGGRMDVAGAMLNGDEGKTAVKRRDHLTSQMTAPQIEQAQEMARRCQQSQFKECD